MPKNCWLLKFASYLQNVNLLQILAISCKFWWLVQEIHSLVSFSLNIFWVFLFQSILSVMMVPRRFVTDSVSMFSPFNLISVENWLSFEKLKIIFFIFLTFNDIFLSLVHFSMLSKCSWLFRFSFLITNPDVLTFDGTLFLWLLEAIPILSRLTTSRNVLSSTNP